MLQVVANAHAILRDAEVGIDSHANFNYLRNWTPKPMPTLEAICSSAVKSAIDMDAVLMCIITNTLAPVRAVCKYRPHQSVVVATTKLHVAQQANICYGTVPLLLSRYAVGKPVFDPQSWGAECVTSHVLHVFAFAVPS